MSKLLSLAMKISADATGVRQSLSPVEKALQQLDKEAAAVTEVFKTFTTASGGASRAQQQFATDLAFLQSALRTGKVDAEQFAAEFAKISEEATKTAASFREGAALTEANRTAEEKRTAELARLNELLKLGAIEQETFNRASAEASGANKAAADAAAAAAKSQADADKIRGEQATRAAAIVEANLTKEQKAQRDYSVSTRELNALRNKGLLTEAEYSAALQRVSKDYAKATLAADKFAEEAKKGGDAGKLKFNELSGVLSALPGPIGNVAGRLSGLSSAGEGLGRVFSGGLNKGLASVSTQFTGLLTTTNLALVGVAAFGAAAVAVVQGLTTLEDRVEKLGNTADKLGLSFEFIQTLEAAAARSGTSIDSVSSAFGRLQKSVLGVDEESKAAQAALAAIGVTSEELAALSPEEQYLKIGQALNTIEDPARRTATATALFGKAGADLLPFFRNIPGAATDMERFGRALTEIDRRRIDEFGAGLDALGVATQGLGQSLLLPFVGLGEGIAKALANVFAGVTRIADPIGRVLGPVLEQLGSVVEVVGIGLNAIASIFGVLAAAIEPIGGYLLPAILIQLAAINSAAILGGISSLVTTFVSAGAAAIAYATSAGVASVATVALGTAIRATLASTGIGVLVVGFGLAANALLEWATSADETSDTMNKAATNTGSAADQAKRLAEETKRAADEAQRLADADKQVVEQLLEQVRINSEFGGDEKRFKASEIALATEREIGRVRDEVVKAVMSGEDELANNGRERIRQLQVIANEQRLIASGSAQAAEDEKETLDERAKRLDEDFKRRIDADRQVIEQLQEEARVQREFAGDAGRAKAAEQVLAIEREIARVREEVTYARDAGDEQAVVNGKERIRQLNVLADEQQSIADGSAKAAEDERKRLDDQRKRVDEMLAAGQEQTAIEQNIIAVQEQQARATNDLLVARRTSNQAEADAAVARLAQLDQLQAKLEDQQQASEQGFGQGFAAAFEQVDAAIGKTINRAAEFGNAGALAAQQLKDGITQAQEQARDGIFNKEAFDAEVQRQQELFDNEVKRLEDLKKKKIKDADDVEKAQEQARGEAIKAQDRNAQQQLKAQETFAAQQQQAQQKYLEEQQKAAEEQQKAAAAEALRQEDRLQKLNTLGSSTVKTTDVRTGEGAALVLDLAANAQDPALIEQRIQTKILNQIALGLAGAAANYFNQPVAIVGAARIGGFN